MKKTLALLMSLVMLFGMVSFASAEEVVTLKWVTVGSGMPDNYQSWADKLNAYLEEKIGVHIDMEVISWGDWDRRRNVIVSTNEPYDIIFGNNMSYNADVKLGAYAEITKEMLEANAPDLLKLIPESYWNACNVDGKLYAVPTYKDSSMSQYFVWDNELLTREGQDVTNIHDLAGLEPVFEALKDKVGNNYLFPSASNGFSAVMMNYDGLGAGLPTMGVRYDDAERKVVFVMEQADIMDQLKILHKYFQAEYINPDAATAPEEQKYRVCGIAQGWPSAAKTVWGPNMGVEALAVQFGDTIVSNDTVQGSLNSISVNCEHPDKALQFLNLINSDSYVRDSFFYGEEGVDWEYTADKKVHRLQEVWKMAGYTQGTFFIVSQLDNVDFNQWDEVKQLNENAKPSQMLGFYFDTTPVLDQISKCTEIFGRYAGEILTGTVDPEDEAKGVGAMMKEMRAAGYDEIVAEAQKQIDAWKN